MKQSGAVAGDEKQQRQQQPEAVQQGSPQEERMETCGDANWNREKEKRREAKVSVRIFKGQTDPFFYFQMS